MLGFPVSVCSNSCPLHQWYLPTSVALPFSPCPQSFPASGGQSVSNELALCIRWLQYRSFSISPPNEYSGLIFFRIDQFDFPAVQGTLQSCFQHHSLKASIRQSSDFLKFKLSNPHVTIGKAIALTIQTFVSKVMLRLSSCVTQHAEPGYKSVANTTSSWYPTQNGDTLLTPEKSWGPPGGWGEGGIQYTEQLLGTRFCIRVCFCFCFCFFQLTLTITLWSKYFFPFYSEETEALRSLEIHPLTSGVAQIASHTCSVTSQYPVSHRLNKSYREVRFGLEPLQGQAKDPHGNGLPGPWWAYFYPDPARREMFLPKPYKNLRADFCCGFSEDSEKETK